MPVVVKPGGSLFREPGNFKHVAQELDRLRGRVVVVPGGGVFADCVRSQQAQLRFDDETAHLMAIMAMHQNGYVLENLLDRLVAISRIEHFSDVWERGKIPVWMPFAECERDFVLERNWSVSSDAIAARLAERMSELEFGRTSVLLIKSCRVEPDWGIDKMMHLGVIDPVFGSIVKRAGLASRVLGVSGVGLMGSVINEFEECST